MEPGPVLAQGRTAEVFAWNEDAILKLYYDWCPAEWVENEIERARYIEQLGLPVPRLLERVSVKGRPGLVYERVHGPSLLQVLASRPWRVVALARLLAQLQADIHRHDGAGLPSLQGYLSRAIPRAPALSSGEKEQILWWLRQLSGRQALCHFDFHPDQVLMAPTGPVIIDWMTANCGDPLADVARTSLMLSYGSPTGEQRGRDAVLSLFRRLFHDRYLRAYLALHPGLDQTEIEAWKVPVAAARLCEEIASEKAPLLAYLRRALFDNSF